MRPHDKQLKLDLSEVQACLAAVTSATLKSMGDKRFHSKVIVNQTLAFAFSQS